MNKMFLSCLKATELIEKKFLFKLSVQERIQLKIHKMMCDACTLYEKQSNILDKVLSGLPEKEGQTTELNNLKKDILKKIEESE